MTLSNGTTIADRYRLMRLIATGGKGQVWKRSTPGSIVGSPSRCSRPSTPNDPEFTAGSAPRRRSRAMLNNPGIANVFDYGEPRPGTSGPARLPGDGTRRRRTAQLRHLPHGQTVAGQFPGHARTDGRALQAARSGVWVPRRQTQQHPDHLYRAGQDPNCIAGPSTPPPSPRPAW